MIQLSVFLFLVFTVRISQSRKLHFNMIYPYPLLCHRAFRMLFLKSKILFCYVILVFKRLLTRAVKALHLPCDPTLLLPVSSVRKGTALKSLLCYLWFFIPSSFRPSASSTTSTSQTDPSVSTSLRLHWTTLVLVTIIFYGDQQPRWQMTHSHLLTGLCFHSQFH